MDELQRAEYLKALNQNPALAIARVIGSPFDPRNPFTDLIGAVCDTMTVDGSDYTYYHSALLPTNKVIVANAANGALTELKVSPQTPTQMTFAAYNTQNFYMTLKDLVDAKEQTIARKRADITADMDLYENYLVVTVLDALAGDSGNDVYIDSGTARYTYKTVIDQIEQIRGYASQFVLLKGDTVQSDMLKWDWNDNKYISIYDAYNRLKIKEIDVSLAEKVTVDGSVKQVLDADKAIMVGFSPNLPRPVIFARESLAPIKGLSSIMAETDKNADRVVIAGANPITISSTNTLAFSMVGYSQISVVGINQYAVSVFQGTLG